MKFQILKGIPLSVLLALSLLAQLSVLPVNAEDRAVEFGVAIAAYDRKDYKQAEEHFRKAIELGEKSAKAWLYSAHTFMALGQYPQAYKTYEIVTRSFKNTPEAQIALQGMNATRGKAAVPTAAATTPATATKGQPASAQTAPATPGAVGLAARIIIIAPLMNHPPCSSASIKAVQDAVSGLPPHLRSKLDNNGASIVLSPNLIDRWPNSLNDLPEDKDEPTLAELGGRIYGKEMCVYERPKVRGSTNLGTARAPRLIKHTVLNMCFQVLDDEMTLSKDPGLRAAYELDKQSVPESMTEKLATFLKNDDWGPRETCAEMTGAMLGGGDEYTDDLFRCFPNTRKWLRTKLQI
ncbi:MAG: tetratricopeptide repeat protein [Candidatus Obscuribacter sp.]|nr:tetratricopeptide repeat protein [Candidatus Obscuribacter sp.]